MTKLSVRFTVHAWLLMACLVLGCGGLRSGNIAGGSGGASAGGKGGKPGGTGSGGAVGTGGTIVAATGGAAGAIGAGSGGAGGAAGAPNGSGGTIAAGGTPGTGGNMGGKPGGMTGSTGGVTAAGGTPGSGGMGGQATGGAIATGGVVGTGGTVACQGTATQCMGAKIQTCSNGQWGPATACPMRQECTGASGAASCTCVTDSVCSGGQVGNRCNGAALATCAQDTAGCFYQSMSMTCGGHQTCTGAAGQATCACTVDPVCTSAGAFCATSTSIGMCQQDGTCLYQGPATPCTTGTVCERVSPALCADPNWAAWPIPAATNVTTYTDNGDGTISDRVTGLIWQKSLDAKMAFSSAGTYCSGLTLGGQTGWRVPTKIELMSIIDYGRTAPAINPTAFPSTPADFFASTTWSIYFQDGTTYVLDTGGSFYVRCVR